MAILRDARYAARGLSRSPLFSASAILSLTLGIATATIVFSLVSAALLRPPPFAEAHRLVVLNITQSTPAEGELPLRWSWPRFRLLEAEARSFDGIATSSNNVLTMTGLEEPEPIRAEFVSSGYLSVLRAPLVLGQGFTRAEDSPETASPLVILGHDLWLRRFGGEAGVVGRTMRLNGITLTVAGVVDRGFRGVSGLAQAWVPAGLAPQVTFSGYLTSNENFITVIGRIRPDVSVATAQSEMRTLGERIHAALPSEADTPEDRFSAALLPLNRARSDVVTRRALLMLAGAAGLLLLISCANVASLLLGRAAARRREIALRLAIGAGRRRLIRQLLVESGILALISGVLGVIVTMWATAVVRIPPTLARGRNFYGAIGEFAEPAVDWRVLAFAVALCAATTLLFGMVPALRATRADLLNDIKGVQATGGGKRFNLRELVVALQVSLAIVLVVGCGLLLTSYSRLRETPLGFDATQLLTFMIRPSEVKYGAAEAPALIARVLEEIEAVPGVAGATVDGCAPLTTQCAGATLQIVGRPWAMPADAPIVMRHYVAPSHFRTLAIPVVRGRPLEADDRAGRERVVVINQAAAREYWPDEDPIGRRVWFEGGASAFASPDSSAVIVGIVGDVAYQPLDENPVQPGFFTMYAQFTYANRMLLVRTQSDALSLVPQIAAAVRRADPDLPLFDVQTMEQRAQLSWSKQTAQTAVFTIIAAMALILAVTGVYAVAAFFVTSHSRDIGIRIALGASASAVVRASTVRIAQLGMAGALSGLAGAVVLSRVLRATLYQTSPLDASVYLGTVGVLILALGAACWVPVRHALRVNPVEVLRNV